MSKQAYIRFQYLKTKKTPEVNVNGLPTFDHNAYSPKNFTHPENRKGWNSRGTQLLNTLRDNWHLRKKNYNTNL